MATLATRNTVTRKFEPASFPIKHDLALAYAASLLVAGLVAVVSVTALIFGSAALYGVDPKVATGVTASTAGLLVPGFLAQDVFNLVVALPILLGSLWLARLRVSAPSLARLGHRRLACSPALTTAFCSADPPCQLQRHAAPAEAIGAVSEELASRGRARTDVTSAPGQ